MVLSPEMNTVLTIQVYEQHTSLLQTLHTAIHGMTVEFQRAIFTGCVVCARHQITVWLLLLYVAIYGISVDVQMASRTPLQLISHQNF